MTRYLLDVNVLIALIDPAHVQHDKAHTWFASTGRDAWATCPLTENGVLRIVGHPKYPNSPGKPSTVAHLMDGLYALSGHVFWPDDVSLHDPQIVDQTQLKSSGQLTDTYLLALACAHGGQLATFDARLVTSAVRDGVAGLCVLK
ncbi:MAG: VapC toxin family PIN domain ribonuclease [Comamonadaceae bacterium CG1_02_60_18]|nr:MAG: VapC toxin family PIN domain ribonuclease [Comamonadaceae bacterium CG1_02_60_18]PIQ52157.1 MAG: VapC toxin family PIN domain ribonuclease [Comamonadaceae bacterium CG12_big_fil_rev_8_21_14_0_65_59_15]